MYKFKPGDSVIINNGDSEYEGKIFGIADKTDCNNNKYAVTCYKRRGEYFHKIVSEKDLKLNKIREGDIVKDKYFTGERIGNVEYITRNGEYVVVLITEEGCDEEYYFFPRERLKLVRKIKRHQDNTDWRKIRDG